MVETVPGADVRPAVPQVRRAGVTESVTAGSALAEAFADDPVFAWLIPPGVANRDERLRAFFTSISRSYLRRGKHGYLAGDGVAAALWSAPGSWALPMSEVMRESPWAFKAFGRNLLRALRVQLQIESLHPKTPHHWYLGYLGTRAAHQGQGVGSAVLREVLAPASAAGVPAYLESSNERNLTLYERNGFRAVGELKALDRGPTIWRMWREP